jgi:hypothetical protein
LSEAANIQSRILTLEKEKQGIQSDIVDLSGNALQTDERRAKIAEDQTKRLIQQRETTGDILIHNKNIEASDKIQSAYQREFVTKSAVISKQRADGLKDSESTNKSQKVFNDTVSELQALRKQDEKSYVQLNDLAKAAKIELIDFQGKVIKTYALHADRGHIELDFSVATGIYLLKLTNGNEQLIQKIIK